MPTLTRKLENILPSFRGGIFPFLIYLSGLGSLLAADILITKLLTSDKISDWAEIRSLIGISGILCLCGLDQVLVRSRGSSAAILRCLSVQIPLASLAIGYVIWKIGYIDRLPLAVVLVIVTSISLVGFQYFRSHGMAVRSQLSQQIWKIAFILAFLLMIALNVSIDIDALSVGIMMCSAVMIIMLIIKHPPRGQYNQQLGTWKRLYSVGGRFMGASLFLSLAVYSEQLVVNGFGNVDEGASYFTHATYFLFPISIINGYLAFVIGPWARDHSDKFVRLVQNGRWIVCLLALFTVIVVSAVGWIGWHVIDPFGGNPDYYLQGLFFASCWFRTMDTLPSSFNGIFGHEKQLDALILRFVAAAGIAVLVSLCFAWIFELSIVYSVATFSLVNWILRCHFGFSVTRKIIEGRHHGVA